MTNSYKLSQRKVFNAFLKMRTDDDCLIIIGNSFQYVERGPLISCRVGTCGHANHIGLDELES